MSVSLKLGPSLFQKERRILELEHENKTLKAQLEQMQSQFREMSEIYTNNQKAMNHNQGLMGLREVEFENLQAKYTRLHEDHQKLETEHKRVSTDNKCNEEKIQKMDQEIDKLNDQVSYYQNLELRLKEELSIMEKRNVAYEKNIEDLNGVINHKNHGLETLEKNLQQKNKHIAIVLKEKERLFQHIDQEKSEKKGPKQSTKKIVSNVLEKENNPVEDNLVSKKFFAEQENVKESQLMTEISLLKTELMAKDQAIEKLAKENFNLTNRLRNTKK